MCPSLIAGDDSTTSLTLLPFAAAIVSDAISSSSVLTISGAFGVASALSSSTTVTALSRDTSESS